MADLTQNEKRLLVALAQDRHADIASLAAQLNATPEAVVQWAHLAMDKGLVRLERTVKKTFVYTAEGQEYLKSGLPETQVLSGIGDGITLADLQKLPALRSGLASFRKKGLVTVTGAIVTKADRRFNCR